IGRIEQFNFLNTIYQGAQIMPLGPWPFGESTHFANASRGKLNAPGPTKSPSSDGLFAYLLSFFDLDSRKTKNISIKMIQAALTP
ncbi:MAG TPA: hypothetical protein VFJ84_01360, partial [Candidatus Saccharimonadales bacterium]|nr:hypothetical protein [Candidatus Saccharimonadales bacterium]